MKRKSMIVIILVSVLVLSSVMYLWAGTLKAEKLMWEYLGEKEITQAEIESVHVNHSFLNILLSYNEWSIAVVYSDEPTSIYYYYMKEGVIVEGGVSGTTNKEDLKH